MLDRPLCRWCGDDRMDCLGDAAAWPRSDQDPWASLQPGMLWRCPRCGFGQRHPHADLAELQTLYRGASSAEMAYKPQANAAWSQTLKLLRARPQKKLGNILDVGCHTGSFLAELPSHWQRYGIESAQEPARLAAERHGVKIVAEWIDAIDDQLRGNFDVITLFDVFEHLVNPLQDLRRLATLLRPGGLLIISTGNLDAWPWKLAGTEYWYLQTPLHISFGSQRLFRSLPQTIPLSLVHLKRMPHTLRSPMERLDDMACLLHWQGVRHGGWWRIPQRLIQALPWWRLLRHRQSPPWTMGLSDHLLAVYRHV
jgi:SAM-dependent methyltransferase